MNSVGAHTETEINNVLFTNTYDAEVYPAVDQKANISDTYTKMQTATLLDDKADKRTMTGFLNLKADATSVYTKVEIEQKIAWKTYLDEVSILYQLTAAVGGHFVDLTGKASTTYVNDLAATLTSQINAKANHNFVETLLTALQTNIDAKQDSLNVVSPLA